MPRQDLLGPRRRVRGDRLAQRVERVLGVGPHLVERVGHRLLDAGQRAPQALVPVELGDLGEAVARHQLVEALARLVRADAAQRRLEQQLPVGHPASPVSAAIGTLQLLGREREQAPVHVLGRRPAVAERRVEAQAVGERDEPVGHLVGIGDRREVAALGAVADDREEVAAPALRQRLDPGQEARLVQHAQPQLDPQDVLVVRVARARDGDAEQVPEPPCRRLAGGLLDAAEEPVGGVLEGGDQDLVAGGEVVVHRARGHVRGARHVGDPGRREAALEDRAARGLQDRLEALGPARVGAGRAPRAARGGRRGGHRPGTITDAPIKLMPASAG